MKKLLQKVHDFNRNYNIVELVAINAVIIFVSLTSVRRLLSQALTVSDLIFIILNLFLIIIGILKLWLSFKIIRLQKRIDEYKKEIERIEKNTSEKLIVSPPLSKIHWAFYLLPADRYDIIDNLEDLYERRFLKITNGDKKKADRIFIWQVRWAVFEHHKGKLLAALLSLLGIVGIKGLFKNIKGWFFHKD